MMEFEWDEAKRQRILIEREIDFIDMIPLFQKQDALIEDDLRKEYGERRQVIYGYIGGKLYQVCFTTRSEKIRIISARRANKREIRHYERTRNHTSGSDIGWKSSEKES